MCLRHLLSNKKENKNNFQHKYGTTFFNKKAEVWLFFFFFFDRKKEHPPNIGYTTFLLLPLLINLCFQKEEKRRGEPKAAFTLAIVIVTKKKRDVWKSLFLFVSKKQNHHNNPFHNMRGPICTICTISRDKVSPSKWEIEKSMKIKIRLPFFCITPEAHSTPFTQKKKKRKKKKANLASLLQSAGFPSPHFPSGSIIGEQFHNNILTHDALCRLHFVHEDKEK